MRAPFLCVLALCGAAASARADDAWVGAPVLPDGRVAVTAVHEVLLSTYFYLPDEAGEAWATGVDVAYAVTPRLTLGLGHSARARGTLDHGGGWCHEGARQRCDGAYAGALVDARWRAYRGARWTVAALVRAGVIGLEPVQPVVRLGGSARTTRGPWWLVVEPEVQVALGHREAGNRDVLIVPVWAGVGRGRAAAWVMTGVRGQTVGLREKLEIPFVIGSAVALRGVRVGVEAGWPKLIGPQNTFNVRHGALFVAASF
ncbi:MAG TPA: hypothetical protein VM261_07580 [Kofleriaceae bacterium]|nr:hypothetical protein [Kofleriaceae bacterium]